MAKIYFEHLSLKNFMSYQHAEIDLNRSGNILVGGINNNPEDSAKSNGCGKSTLFSAISWVLTGETVNGAKDVSNIYLDGKTEVSLSFKIDGDNYNLIRTKNPSNLFIYINGENKSGKGVRDTSQIVSNYIPQITSSLINSVIILGQGLPQKFTNNTPAGRKEVLEKLSNSDFMIIDLKERLSKRKLELSESKRRCEDLELTLSTTKKLSEQQLSEYKRELSLLESEDLSTLKEELIILNENLVELKNQEITIQSTINDINSKLNDSKNKKRLIQDDYLNEYKSLDIKDYSKLEEELIELKSQYNSINRQINQYKNIVDVCPTCGQKIPNVHKIDTSSLEKESYSIKEKVDEVNKNILDIKEYNEKLKHECSDRYALKLSKIENSIYEYEIELDSSNSKLNNISKSILEKENKINEINFKISSLDSRKSSLSTSICNVEKNLKDIEEELSINKEELSTVEDRLSINSKMVTYIQRDFRGYLLNNVISFIEEKAKIYSTDIFGTDKLNFKLDKNNIDISYDGKDYSCLSGGERQKLDIIIQFAIRDMLCTFLDFSSNILVLDEITDSLDSVGVSKIFNLISSHIHDVEAIYIISHHVDELEIPSDDEIIIIKDTDKISRIL